MPSPALVGQYKRAMAEYEQRVAALGPLLIRMAIETVADVLPGAQALKVFGEINEDWLPILRIQQVLDAKGRVLFDVEEGHDDRRVEDTIDKVNAEYLDLLLDVTGDEFMGLKMIERRRAANTRAGAP
jgi:hypothetical protein